MSDKLLDDADLAELRDLEVGGMFGTGDIARDGSTVASSVPITIIPTGDYGIHAAIAGLGGGRADHIGFVPYGTDVQDGDVVTSGGRVFAVEGVGLLDTSVGLALSEVGRG